MYTERKLIDAAIYMSFLIDGFTQKCFFKAYADNEELTFVMLNKLRCHAHF